VETFVINRFKESRGSLMMKVTVCLTVADHSRQFYVPRLCAHTAFGSLGIAAQDAAATWVKRRN
jgi:hypothetical protein